MKALLTSSSVGGFFGLLGLFLFSVGLVLVFKFALIGWRQYVGSVRKGANRTEKQAGKVEDAPKNTERAQAETTSKKTEQERNESNPAPPETVYYIVERKKRRPKAEYSEPKEFRFK